jgi:hypothetical protein
VDRTPSVEKIYVLTSRSTAKHATKILTVLDNGDTDLGDAGTRRLNKNTGRMLFVLSVTNCNAIAASSNKKPPVASRQGQNHRLRQQRIKAPTRSCVVTTTETNPLITREMFITGRAQRLYPY